MMAPLQRTPAETELSPVHLAGAVLGARRHVCAFFTGQDDPYRILLPFIKEGFDGGEKAVHILNPQRRSDHESRLAAAGIDLAKAQERHQLELREWREAHLIDGFFDQERTRRLIDGICGRSASEGFRRIRFVTHMEWAVESETSMDALLEYEASVNLTPVDHPVVCAYDLTKFRGDVVVDVMRTHPMVIVGGILQENPFFVPPEEFLRDLRQRGGHASR